MTGDQLAILHSRTIEAKNDAHLARKTAKRAMITALVAATIAVLALTFVLR